MAPEVEEDDYELPQDAPYIPVDANTTAAAEKAKLETLEAELARLRAEMAVFMQAQATSPMSAPHAPSAGSGSASYSGSGNAGEPRTPTRRPTHGAPPAGLSIPPPPPPPTSSFASSFLKSASHSAHTAGPSSIAAPSGHQEASSSHQVQPAEPKQQQSDQQPRTHHHSLSLSDMVKSAGKNTLRKVEGERSPGGTVKREAKTSANPNDMAEVIQQAMRRRFKSVSGSPDTKATQSRVSSAPSDFDE